MYFRDSSHVISVSITADPQYRPIQGETVFVLSSGIQLKNVMENNVFFSYVSIDLDCGDFIMEDAHR